MKHAPFSTSCSNPGRDDYWTCPACYHDLGNIGRGRHICRSCETLLDCPDCGFQVAGPDRLQVERAVGMLWDYGLPYVGETDDGGRA